MDRRKFIITGGLSALALGVASPVLAFKLPSVPGLSGGGGGDWSAIAKGFKAGMTILAKESVVIALAIADLADSIGLRDQAALLRTEAKNLEGKATLSGDEIDGIAEVTSRTVAAASEKIKSSTKLTAQQKVKMAEAASKYAPALVKGALGVVKISMAASKASSAGTPGITDGLEVISLAKDIPILAPKAVSFISNAITGGNQFMEAMREKGVETPKSVEMPEMSI